MQNHQKSILRALLLIGTIAFASAPASASYTVIDDDLLPSYIVEAKREARIAQYRQNTTNTSTEQTYSIPFAKGQTELIQKGRAALREIAAQARKQEPQTIEIVARPDDQPYEEERGEANPQLRGNNIRDYLIRKGVPSQKIVVKIDNTTPNPKTSDQLYASTVYIKYEGNRITDDLPRYASYSDAIATPPPPPPPPKITQQAPPLSKDWEILLEDGTLQNTLNRWGLQANWKIEWQNIPAIKNTAYAKLTNQDFISAADYVLSQVQTVAKSSGLDISITAHPDQILVISKEN